MKDKTDKKITVYEYEEKYSKKENNDKARKIFNLLAFALGVLILVALFSLFKDVYDINVYAGYAVGAVCLILFVILYIVPVIKIKKQDQFEVNASVYTAKKAKKHNEKVRLSLADKIIDIYLNADCSWYDSKKVEGLITAKQTGDNESLKLALNGIYEKDVKKAGNDIIVKSALKSGTYSAISQKDYTDALLVTAINLQMIKDIVYLYGFRPSDAKLMKIFTKVISNSLVAYGLGSVKVGTSVVKNLGDMVKGIPLLGSVISTVIDGSVQGLSNAVLTAVIGRQTINYLRKEYRLQNLLDGVEFEQTDEEFELLVDNLKTALVEQKKHKSKSA